MCFCSLLLLVCLFVVVFVVVSLFVVVFVVVSFVVVVDCCFVSLFVHMMQTIKLRLLITVTTCWSK